MSSKWSVAHQVLGLHATAHPAWFELPTDWEMDEITSVSKEDCDGLDMELR
jgi:hypothetical protein